MREIHRRLSSRDPINSEANSLDTLCEMKFNYYFYLQTNGILVF